MSTFINLTKTNDQGPNLSTANHKPKKLSKGQKKKAAKTRRNEKEGNRNPSGDSGLGTNPNGVELGEIMQELKSINERITQLSVTEKETSKKSSNQANKDLVYIFKISLRDIQPTIWRRFKVDASTSLNRFHLILNAGMIRLANINFFIGYKRKDGVMTCTYVFSRSYVV